MSAHHRWIEPLRPNVIRYYMWALDLLFLLIRREAINIGIRNFDYEFCSYAITEVLRLQNGAYF